MSSWMNIERKQQHSSDVEFWINIVSGMYSTEALVLGNFVSHQIQGMLAEMEIGI